MVLRETGVLGGGGGPEGALPVGRQSEEHSREYSLENPQFP